MEDKKEKVVSFRITNDDWYYFKKICSKKKIKRTEMLNILLSNFINENK